MLSLLMFVGAAVLAQPAAAGAQTMIDFGVQVGLAVTSLPHAGQVFDQIVHLDSSESSSRFGLAGGGYIRFPITPDLGFEPGALFVMKGVQLTEKNGKGTVNVRINYLDVPLLIRWRIPLGSDYTSNVFVGPSFGVKLSSSGKLEGPNGSLEADVDPAIKSLDVGLTFGIGIVRQRYLFDARFTAGLTDVASTAFPHDDSLRNKTFLLLAGMKLP
jgi:hypothetical protein